jgi:hypothetical protein
MIKFFDGRAIYATPDNLYYSKIVDTGDSNRLVFHRFDECDVASAHPDVYLETADDHSLESWIRVGEGIEEGIAERSDFARFVRLAAEMQATANGWEDSHAFYTGDLVTSHGKVWRCTLDHTSSVNDEPDGTEASASEWQDAVGYSESDLVKVSGVAYYCLQNHTSDGAINEPGTGSNWQSYWQINYTRYWEEYDELMYTQLTVLGKLVRS